MYRLFALDTVPAKPGLVRVPRGGAAIAVEIWELSPAGFGDFVAQVPSPMTIGSVELIDGARSLASSASRWPSTAQWTSPTTGDGGPTWPRR